MHFARPFKPYPFASFDPLAFWAFGPLQALGTLRLSPEALLNPRLSRFPRVTLAPLPFFTLDKIFHKSRAATSYPHQEREKL
jgi:hypothetical protein